MALTISVGEARRGRSYRIVGKDGKITLSRTIIYNVNLSGLASYSGVSEPEITSANGLPKVNFTPYEFGGKFIPYLLCRSKKLIETESLEDWKVECKYDSGPRDQEEDDAPQDPPDDPEDLDPKIERSVELIPYHVFKDIDGDPILTPTGNFYAEPAVKLWPILVLTVTQYENTFSDDDLTTRTMVANLNEFRGEDPYKWRIAKVSQQPTTVPVSGGGHQPTNQVRYELQRNTLPSGWRETRALIDTHYLDSNGKKKPALPGGQPGTYWLNTDGTIRDKSLGLLFAQHKLLFETDWAFLSRVDNT